MLPAKEVRQSCEEHQDEGGSKCWGLNPCCKLLQRVQGFNFGPCHHIWILGPRGYNMRSVAGINSQMHCPNAVPADARWYRSTIMSPSTQRSSRTTPCNAAAMRSPVPGYAHACTHTDHVEDLLGRGDFLFPMCKSSPQRASTVGRPVQS